MLLLLYLAHCYNDYAERRGPFYFSGSFLFDNVIIKTD